MLLNISPELPRFIWADALRLKQVLINLLGNATKFTEAGEIELKIEVINQQQADTVIRFSVRDTGIGIKPEQQLKIFQAFSQEDPSTTKKYGGTGLGLTISNRLLALMGSELELKSAPGQGSTFYFNLKVKAEQGEPINWDNIDRIKNVLIVDDNENNRMILGQMLLLKQIKAVEAANGLEALQILSTGKQFDTIIMDYHMPHMDGLETLKKIREIFTSKEDLPVILLYSSADDGKIIKACEKLKVQHRLIKPVKMQDIYNTLSRLHIKDKNSINTVAPKTITAIADKITILVAEDNTVNMLLAKTIFKKIAPNAKVIEAKSGLEALNYCKNHWPDLIFMDLQMPELNGYDATTQIRAFQGERHVPIIALTAGNVKGEKEKCLAAGMDDFVVKPVVEDTLALVFNKWFHHYHKVSPIIATSDESLESLHFDMATLKNYIGDDDEVIKEILNLTKAELSESLLILQKLVAEKELKGLNLTGHKLYGTAVSAGLPILAKLANQFEQMTQFLTDEIDDLLKQTSEEIALILEIIK